MGCNVVINKTLSVWLLNYLFGSCVMVGGGKSLVLTIRIRKPQPNHCIAGYCHCCCLIVSVPTVHTYTVLWSALFATIDGNVALPRKVRLIERGSKEMSKVASVWDTCSLERLWVAQGYPRPCTHWFHTGTIQLNTHHHAYIFYTFRLLYLANNGSGEHKIWNYITVGDGYFLLLEGTLPNMSAILLVPLWNRKACNHCTEITDL